MTEKDLVKLGFVKVEVSAQESGDKAFYYYTWDPPHDYCGISLISNDSDNKDGKWFAEIFGDSRIRFTKKKDVKAFIKLINNNSVK